MIWLLSPEFGFSYLFVCTNTKHTGKQQIAETKIQNTRSNERMCVILEARMSIIQREIQQYTYYQFVDPDASELPHTLTTVPT